MLNNDTIYNIFEYIPLKQYKVDRYYHNIYLNYVKSKIRIIINFLKKIIQLKKICKRDYLISNSRNFTKNTIIKFIIINYSYHRDCGLPEIMVGSYNLNTDLLNIINNIYQRQSYDLYKFLKQKEISRNILINCWYSFYIY